MITWTVLKWTDVWVFKIPSASFPIWRVRSSMQLVNISSSSAKRSSDDTESTLARGKGLLSIALKAIRLSTQKISSGISYNKATCTLYVKSTVNKSGCSEIIEYTWTFFEPLPQPKWGLIAYLIREIIFWGYIEGKFSD